MHLLDRAAGQRRVPHRRARAGQVVRRRHRAEGRQVRLRDAQPARRRGRRAAHRRGTRAAAPVPDRAGVRDLGPPGHRRDDRAARRPRPLAGRAARARRATCSSARRVLRAVGRQGVARARCAGDAVPVASRIAQLAEFVEVALPHGRHRRRCASWPAPGAASSSTPTLSTLVLDALRRRSFDGLDERADLGRGGRGRAGAGPRRSSATSSTLPCSRSPTSSTSSRRTPSVTRGRVAELAVDAAAGARAARPPTCDDCCAAPRSSAASDGSASPTPSGTSRGRWAPASGSGFACTRTSPSGCSSSRRRWRRWARSRSSMRERLDGGGYPRGLTAARSRRRPACWPRPTPTRRCASRGRTARRCSRRRGRGRAARRGRRPDVSTPPPSTRCSRRRATACRAAARARPG